MCALRDKDIDFSCRQVIIRDGKGQKDRIAMLPMIMVLDEDAEKLGSVFQPDGQAPIYETGF